MSKINVDFFVNSDPYHLMMSDTSSWGLITEKISIVEITLPGSDKFVTKVWDKAKVNVANSHILGITCPTCVENTKTTLPDGIYKITVKGSPDKFNKTRYYLKTDMFDMELDKLFIENKDCDPNGNFGNKMTEVEFAKKTAEAFLRADNVKHASFYFQSAQKLLNDLKGCKTCK